ncbi:YkgJ family cysteine cluster protein [bacterium]|nr:YkgJ family cysteine cluster protein [bacterium]
MLTAEYERLKSSYREVFLDTANEIRAIVESVRPKNFDGDIFKTYEVGSVGFNWQQTVLSVLDVRYCGYKKSGLRQIQSFRDECNCVGCGVCCNFAVSEFSPEELKLKAENGDNFASQFVSVFVPYEEMNEVEKIYPEYVQMLKDNGESEYYFYHCPKVTDDNKCPDYENRPQICRDFPDNPIAFLPKTCGFKDWKLKSESVSLKLNAEAEIINFYKEKIKELY